MAGNCTVPSFNIVITSSPEDRLLEPRTTGTLLCCANARAWILSPNNCNTLGDGPTHVILEFTSDCANGADSDRNPYPNDVRERERDNVP